MILNRIDKKKHIDKPVERIEIYVDADKFTITESANRIKIHAHHGTVRMQPGCANEIYIWSQD